MLDNPVYPVYHGKGVAADPLADDVARPIPYSGSHLTPLRMHRLCEQERDSRWFEETGRVRADTPPAVYTDMPLSALVTSGGCNPRLNFGLWLMDADVPDILRSDNMLHVELGRDLKYTVTATREAGEAGVGIPGEDCCLTGEEIIHGWQREREKYLSEGDRDPERKLAETYDETDTNSSRKLLSVLKATSLDRKSVV